MASAATCPRLSPVRYFLKSPAAIIARRVIAPRPRSRMSFSLVWRKCAISARWIDTPDDSRELRCVLKMWRLSGASGMPRMIF